jgi:multidrug efflux system membrane fusion protein
MLQYAHLTMPSPTRSLLRPRRFAALLACLGLAVLLAGCAGREARRATRAPVTVAAVERRAVPLELEATGTVEPAATADVTAQVGGLVTQIAFREGDDVRAGAALVLLDPRPFEASVAQTSAVLARDRAQARSARLELDRAETLARQQLLAAGELDDKRGLAEALAATVLADSANLVKARLDLAYATVRAPIAGRTGGLRVHVGDVVKPSDPANPVVTIHQLRPIRVRFTIPQDRLEELRGERKRDVHVLVAAGSSDTVWTEGRLAFIDNQIESATGTVLVKGEFENRDGALWPGAFARVRLRLREQAEAIVVPTAAVNSSQNGPYCYVLQPDTTAQMRPVTLVRQWRGLTVIASGLQPGEIVVTDGQMRLSPGARAVVRTPVARAGLPVARPAAGRRP